MTNAEYARRWRRQNTSKVKAYRKANQERRRLQAAEWRSKNPDRIKVLQTEWRSKNREHIRKRHREWQRQNPPDPAKRRKYNHSIEQSARMALRVEVRAGRIARPATCARCGIPCTPHGHHPDYAKPLEVIWMCGICHSQEHRQPS